MITGGGWFLVSLVAGNPAGVCFLDMGFSPNLRQKIASELNQPATAFVVVGGEDPCKFQISWFSPMVQLPLCGHGTLAAAALIFMKNPSGSKVRG